MTRTLAIDCGGSGIKGSVLDGDGAPIAERVRIATPYPLPPTRLIDSILELAAQLPTAARATVGMPGMIRHGIVIRTPHYITASGPSTAIDANLDKGWSHFDVRGALIDALAMPTIVLNDAEVHGAGVIEGAGLEVMLTFGTGLGCAIFDDGRLAPHLELSQASVLPGVTYDAYIGNIERQQIGNNRWSRRVARVVAALEPVFVWDRLYLGGGNAKRLKGRGLADLGVGEAGSAVGVVPNAAGILGGVRAWALEI